jgi:Tfp pilus assembly protein PilX
MMRSVRAQQGATLLVGLIMLVVLSLFLVSSLNTSSTNLKVVGNMQTKTEALAAAQETIETVISTPTFISNPANAVPTPCGSLNKMCTDLNGDGVAEFTTTLTPQPTCLTARWVKNPDLNLNNSEDLGCVAGAQQQFGVLQQQLGVVNAVGANSRCGVTIWEINAQTVGNSSAAAATVTQGVTVRINADDVETSCL